MGPIEPYNTKGNTPVLDIGKLQKIKSGKIQIVPGIKKIQMEFESMSLRYGKQICNVVICEGVEERRWRYGGER
ncbi:hypothetical protein L1987_19601 [Smallanthus sonchifolius]|uniref:Uncharacterized protein n=1 Tax=Smallanthus sonchifolius TaxID=185202 RepID=A0ACB9IR69_9ASTR|nr:hypothetical protein L1987_19601 [Smallanthus sonchifolius]